MEDRKGLLEDCKKGKPQYYQETKQRFFRGDFYHGPGMNVFEEVHVTHTALTEDGRDDGTYGEFTFVFGTFDSAKGDVYCHLQMYDDAFHLLPLPAYRKLFREIEKRRTARRGGWDSGVDVDGLIAALEASGFSKITKYEKEG